MATFTVTTAVNMDSLAGKTGDDTFNVNGGTLTIDRHTRFGANPANSFGSIAASPTLGGTVKFRSDTVRLLWFSGGTGTVPAFDTVVSQGGASGRLIGVHTALNAPPLTPGAAMPASGFLQVTQWNGVGFTAGALTGVTATCVADPVFGTFDRAGFVIIVGRDSRNTSLSRLNNPSDDVMVGGWFLMGITDGNRSTTYQVPSNGDAMFIGGVQVETAPGSGVFEWWPVTSSAMTSGNLRASGEESRQCHLTPATASIRFGSDGVNSTGGGCPPAGCVVRVPSLLLQSCTAAAPNTNAFSAIGSRYYLYAAGSGKWRVSGVSSAWRSNVVSSAYEVSASDSSFCGTLSISGNATPFELDNVCLSMPVDASVAASAFNVSNAAIGGTVTGSVLSLGNMNGLTYPVVDLSAMASVAFESCKLLFSGGSSGMKAVSSSIISDVTFNNCFMVGAHSHSQATDCACTGCRAVGTPGDPFFAASGVAWLALGNKSSGWLVSDIEFPASETLTKGNLITVSGASSGNKFRNLGSADSPISAGSALATDLSWTRSGSTITVTMPGHGWRTNDLVVVVLSTDTTATSRREKFITVVDADTFTYVGVASGATSGTLTLFRTFCGVVVSVVGGDDNEFQNIWVEGAYSRPLSISSGVLRTTALNVYGGVGADASSVAGSDSTVRAVATNGAAPAALSSQYGYCWQDGPTIRDLSASPSGSGVSWSRSGSTVVVTSPDHGLDVAQRVRVTSPSDAAPMGDATALKTAVPLSKDTFRFAGASSGATSGTLDWAVATDKLTLFMNEQSASVARYTVEAGTPAFTGAGVLAATTPGDRIMWEMPEPLRNYTGFAPLPIETAYGETVTGQGQFLFEYDVAVDGGEFSGVWRNLSRIMAATGGTSGTPVMTFADTSGIEAGDRVWGLNVPTGAFVASVDSATQITLSASLLGTASGDMMFNHLPAETFTDTFRLRVRVTTLVANSTSLTFVNVPLTSDAASRATLYPIISVLQTQEVNLVNGVPGSRIQIFDLTSGTELVNEVVGSFPFNWTDPDPYVADREIRVRCAYVDGPEAMHFVDEIIGTATNADPVLTYRLNQVDDTVYGDNAVDGSTVAGVTIDDSTMLVEIATPSVSCADLYAFEMWWLSTEDGIRDAGQTITAVDTANYRVSGVKLKNTTAPSEPLSITGGWMVDNATGKMADLLDVTGGSIFNAPDHIVPFATGSGVTPADVANIADAVWDEDLAGHAAVWSAGRTLVDTEQNTDITQAKVNQL